MKTVKTGSKMVKTAAKKTVKKVVNKVNKVAAKTVTQKKPAAKKMVLKTIPKTVNKTESKAAPKTSPKVIKKGVSETPANVPAKTTEAKIAKPKNQFEGNPYRAGKFYGQCFDVLAKMGLDKPVSRKALLEAYCKASGKSEKLGRYDLAVILSPTKEGQGHRSSRKDFYFVERLEDGLVRLHMVKR